MEVGGFPKGSKKQHQGSAREVSATEPLHPTRRSRGINGRRETDIFVRDFLEPNNGISFVNLLAKIQRSREFMTEDR